MYGVVLGVLNGAELYTAVFNFSGIYAYILYFVLWMLRPNPVFLMKIIFWVGYAFLVYSISILIYSLSTGYYDERIITSFNDARVLYSVSALCVLSIIGVKSWEVFVNRELWSPTVLRLMIYLLPAIFSTFLFLATFSKGYFLACIFIVSWFLCLSLIRVPKLLIVDKSLLLYTTLFLLVIILIFVSENDIYELIRDTLSDDNVANAARSIQSKFLVNEFTFFGSGLGVKLHSGYMREDSGVQFELIYHNIVHKTGIVSLLILLPIAGWIFISLKESTKLGMRGKCGSFSLGLFAVVFVSYGNPVLFSLQSVIAQSIALYILSRQQNFLRPHTLTRDKHDCSK